MWQTFPLGLKTRFPGLKVRGYTNGLARIKLLKI
jgi:hypothetical protein